MFKDIHTGEVVKFYPGSHRDHIKEMLDYLDTVDVLIMHNGIGYDLPLLNKLYLYEFKGRKIDTLILSRMFNTRRMLPFNCPNKRTGPHSIEAWGYRVGRGKPEHDDWDNFSMDMLHRCSEDVEIQHLVYNELLKEEQEHGIGLWKHAKPLNMRLFEILQKQEEYGWLVDREWMDKCISMLDHWIERIDKNLTPMLPLVIEVNEGKVKGEYNYVKKPFKKDGTYSAVVQRWLELHGFGESERIVGGPFSRINFRPTNLNSNVENKNFLLSLGWEPKEYNYNDDGERTSPKLSKDDPFDGIQGGIGRLAARRVQCRQRKSIIEGWIRVIRPDGRIPSIVNTLAATGRATHRNIVNVPGAKSFFGKWMRKIYIAKKGWTLVGTDSDACQIRMLAGRMNDPDYTDVVLNGKKENGTDMHSVNMRAAGLYSRDDAKTFFYGFLFGAGDEKVGKIVHGTAADGKRLKADFLEGLPALGALVEKLTAEWRKNAKKRYNAKWNKMEYYNGWVTGLDGRPIHIASEHAILVYVLQSDEAIMMAAAYCRFEQQMEKAGYLWYRDYGIVCWMHDEFTVECRPEIAEHVGELAEEAIEWAGAYYKIPCPHVGDAQIGGDWFEIH